METNYEVLEQFKAQNKAFEVLMKKFDLSVEKFGSYEPASIKKHNQKKTFYSKPSH
jgi:hypothetical protein